MTFDFTAISDSIFMWEGGATAVRWRVRGHSITLSSRKNMWSFPHRGTWGKKNKDRNVLSAALHTSRVLTQRVTWLSDLFRLQLKIPHNFLKTPFSYHSMHHAQIIKSVVYRLPTCLLSFDCMNGFPYSPLGQKMMLTFMYIYLA